MRILAILLIRNIQKNALKVIDVGIFHLKCFPDINSQSLEVIFG